MGSPAIQNMVTIRGLVVAPMETTVLREGSKIAIQLIDRQAGQIMNEPILAELARKEAAREAAKLAALETGKQVVKQSTLRFFAGRAIAILAGPVGWIAGGLSAAVSGYFEYKAANYEREAASRIKASLRRYVDEKAIVDPFLPGAEPVRFPGQRITEIKDPFPMKEGEIMDVGPPRKKKEGPIGDPRSDREPVGDPEEWRRLMRGRLVEGINDIMITLNQKPSMLVFQLRDAYDSLMKPEREPLEGEDPDEIDQVIDIEKGERVLKERIDWYLNEVLLGVIDKKSFLDGVIKELPTYFGEGFPDSETAWLISIIESCKTRKESDIF